MLLSNLLLYSVLLLEMFFYVSIICVGSMSIQRRREPQKGQDHFGPDADIKRVREGIGGSTLFPSAQDDGVVCTGCIIIHPEIKYGAVVVFILSPSRSGISISMASIKCETKRSLP